MPCVALCQACLECCAIRDQEAAEAFAVSSALNPELAYEDPALIAKTATDPIIFAKVVLTQSLGVLLLTLGNCCSGVLVVILFLFYCGLAIVSNVLFLGRCL